MKKSNLSKDFSGQDPFLLFYGDQYMDSQIFEKIVGEFSENEYDGLISAKVMEDPTKWGILKSNSEGLLEKIIEKPPDDRYGNLANAGVYIFNQDIFDETVKKMFIEHGDFLSEYYKRNNVIPRKLDKEEYLKSTNLITKK